MINCFSSQQQILEIKKEYEKKINLLEKNLQKQTKEYFVLKTIRNFKFLVLSFYCFIRIYD